MRKCWAEVIGGCSGGISAEHVISQGLFGKKSKVQIQGFPFLNGKPKLVGIGALTANILCRHHNSALSNVDDEGKSAFMAMRRFEEILSGRQKPRDEHSLCHKVNGPLIERWFLKHAINLFAVTQNKCRWFDGSECSSPPRTIVEAAMGLVPLNPPNGLYNFAAQKLGDYKVIGDQVGFIPIFDPSDSLYVGAQFEFQALSFLIWFNGGKNGYIPSPRLQQFYRHVGCIFQAPPVKAFLNFAWS